METTFSERLSVLPNESYKAFAKRSGIPYGTLRHYLDGRSPKVEHLIALAKAGGVSIEWLATGKDNKSDLEAFQTWLDKRMKFALHGQDTHTGKERKRYNEQWNRYADADLALHQFEQSLRG